MDVNAGFGPLPSFRLSPLIDIVLALRRNGQSAVTTSHVYKQVFVGGGSEPAAPLVCPSSMEPRAKLKTSPIGMVERPPAQPNLARASTSTLARFSLAAGARDGALSPLVSPAKLVRRLPSRAGGFNTQLPQLTGSPPPSVSSSRILHDHKWRW